MDNAIRNLLAEDHPVNCEVAEYMLRRLGYLADVAVNGLEVLDAVKTRRYPVVLMDLRMPEMDGLEAARRMIAETKLPITTHHYRVSTTTTSLSCPDHEHIIASRSRTQSSNTSRVRTRANHVKSCEVQSSRLLKIHEEQRAPIHGFACYSRE